MSKAKLKRVIWIMAIALLGLAIVLPAINWAWCAYAIPAEFSGAGMSGTFHSDRYFSVSGHLFVKPIKPDLSCGETCEVEAILYYNLWSFYRPGQTVRTRLACTVFDNQVEGSNFSAPARYERAVEFTARQRDQGEPLIRLIGIPGSTTVGSYRTADPDDVGHFVAASR